MLAETLPDINFIEADSRWVKEGLLLVKSEQIQVVDVCPFELKMVG